MRNAVQLVAQCTHGVSTGDVAMKIGAVADRVLITIYPGGFAVEILLAPYDAAKLARHLRGHEQMSFRAMCRLQHRSELVVAEILVKPITSGTLIHIKFVRPHFVFSLRLDRPSAEKFRAALQRRSSHRFRSLAAVLHKN